MHDADDLLQFFRDDAERWLRVLRAANLAQQRETRAQVDAFVRRLVEDAYERGRDARLDEIREQFAAYQRRRSQKPSPQLPQE